jgi:hypothetical protein
MKVKKIICDFGLLMGMVWNGALMADLTAGTNNTTAATMVVTGAAPATASASATKAAPPETPEDKAYREQMVALSNAISAKITEIQAKQQELNQEVYLVARPAVQGELDALNNDLNALELQKKQLEAQKTVRDLSKPASGTNQ